MNFFRRLFDFVFGDEETKKYYRLMKTTLKNIRIGGYGNFYKPFFQVATPHMARYFYSVYKMCAGPQKILKNSDVMPSLERAVLNYYMDDETRRLVNQIKTKYITEQYESGVELKYLSKQVNDAVNALNKKLDGKWRKEVDRCYHLISSFVLLVNFDYYGLLKNFNDKLTEYYFTSKPGFSKIPAIKIIDRLKDFLAIADGIDFDSNWNIMFDILRGLNKKAVVPDEIRKDVFAQTNDVIRSKILHHIIQHVSKDTEWKSVVNISRQIIATSFLNEITNTVHKTMFTILNTEKDNAIDRYKRLLFGSDEDIARAVYYIEEHNETYDGMGVEGFKFTDVFNYCMAFFSLYFSKIKTICDMFIIYGKWSNPNDMHELSQFLHELTILNDQLLQYDKSLSPSGERGNRLQHLEKTSVHSRAQRNNLRRYLSAINDEVLCMVYSIEQTLSSLHVFFAKLKIYNDAELAKEIVNARTVCSMLNDSGCDIIAAEEKAAVFLSLLYRLGFTKSDN
jgi:hypothetical protein